MNKEQINTKKRLTMRTPEGIAYMAKVKNDEQVIEGAKNTLECLHEAFQRLADYEDAEEQCRLWVLPCVELSEATQERNRWKIKAEEWETKYQDAFGSGIIYERLQRDLKYYKSRCEALERVLLEARPAEDWHEDYGEVLWWAFPIEEPPYCGSPLCSTWPGYHTHWTPIICPYDGRFDEEKKKVLDKIIDQGR